jgi:hypothetical protein
VWIIRHFVNKNIVKSVLLCIAKVSTEDEIPAQDRLFLF